MRDLAVAFYPVIVCQCLLFTCFALAGYWWAYFVLWVLPLVTFATFFNGFRTFADHADPTIPVEHDNADERLISYESSAVERFFLSPFHMNYHAEHHLFPNVPHYHLPEIRRLMQASPELRARVKWRRGYLSAALAYIKAVRAPRRSEMA